MLDQSLSGLLAGTNLLWEALPGANVPDNTVPRVSEALKPFHHVKVVIRGGAYFAHHTNPADW